MKKYCAKHRYFCVSILAFALFQGTAFAEPATQEKIERMFRGALTTLLDNRPDTALSLIKKSSEISPNFRLMQILRADLLAAYAHQKPLIAIPQALQKRRVAGLRDEMLARFLHHPPQQNDLPQGILQLSTQHPFAIMLDASQSRLYLFRNDNGKPRLINHYYASIGIGGMGKTAEGDNKTPTGVYQIVTYLEDDKLPELYGDGAYTLNYPNNWDKRLQYHGHGIWIHGIPRQLSSRPPQDSRGCIILDNTLIHEMQPYLLPGTPVLLVPRITWLSPQAWQAQRRQLLAQVNSWQHDWERMDIERYLRYYSPKYKTEEQNYRQMMEQARRNAKKKTFVRVKIQNIDLFIPPHQPKLAQIVFDQNYRSNNYNIQYRKQQIWQQSGNDWKIIYEGKS